jgi:hypothetical protein
VFTALIAWMHSETPIAGSSLVLPHRSGRRHSELVRRASLFHFHIIALHPGACLCWESITI